MWTTLSRLPPLDRSIVFQLFLVVLWVSLLSWGERGAFTNSATSCRWDKWEQWPTEANPHHVLFVADPQLVDPHTYPGRPWPLSSFTIKHTDQYMRRAFTSMQSHLRPQTVMFLGDLFDGGREWSTRYSKSPEARWHKYGNKFWLKEYERFVKIFIDPWVARREQEPPGSNAKFLATLPGNHDLGFSNGIQLPVRDRFQMYFGESNRVDIIGNHSFVSVDTVSLSARAHQQAGHDNRAVWQPAEQFLDQTKKKKTQVLDRALRDMFHKGPTNNLEHTVVETDNMDAKAHSRKIPSAKGDMPTILLSHVPLHRAPATPCGPLRERWPPSKISDEPLEKDEQNSIKVVGGYQYQNVLDETVSKELIDKIGGIVHAFSGDDHDYCEVIHRGYSSRGGGIKEITVKSLSWAMGVRKPGFLLLSLWNPVDEDGNSLPRATKPLDSTTQTQLCLLPDQLGVFIRYLNLFLCTILLLAFDSLLVSVSSKSKHMVSESLLPVSNPRHGSTTKERSRDSTSCSTSSNSDGGAQLASRLGINKSRSSSPSKNHGYGLPVTPDSWSSGPEEDSYSNGKHTRTYSRSAPLTKKQVFALHFRGSFIRVASVGLFWYAWLALTV